MNSPFTFRRAAPCIRNCVSPFQSLVRYPSPTARFLCSRSPTRQRHVEVMASNTVCGCAILRTSFISRIPLLLPRRPRMPAGKTRTIKRLKTSYPTWKRPLMTRTNQQPCPTTKLVSHSTTCRPQLTYNRGCDSTSPSIFTQTLIGTLC